MARVWLDVYVDEADCDALLRLLKRAKENMAGADDPIPSLDWGVTFEEDDVPDLTEERLSKWYPGKEG